MDWNLGGIDYSPRLQAVIFSAGNASVSIDVSIDDTTFEGNESFLMTIDRFLLPSGVDIGNHGQATVIIVDDDRK